MSVKIYTKKGDKGFSSTRDGIKRRKDDTIFEVLGNLDELNCNIGLLKCWTAEYDSILFNIQHKLLDVGSFVSTSVDHSEYKNIDENIDIEKETKEIENVIDTITKSLPPLKNFVIPGGTAGSSYSHICRAVCRRVERSLVRYMREQQNQTYEKYIAYINRLSDFFFQYARYISHSEDILHKSR